jgi:hypothetical protein
LKLFNRFQLFELEVVLLPQYQNHPEAQSPNLAELPKYFDSLNAVSAVIRLFPFIISDTLVCGIPIPLDNRYALIPVGRETLPAKFLPDECFSVVSYPPLK